MDLFNSPWLINMLAKSSKTAQGRLLSLFDILDDWLKAPNVDKKAAMDTAANSTLVAYCAEQAKLLGAESPKILAEHIVLIARSAAQQAIEQPESNSLAHAKKAAHALILAQTHKAGLLSSLKESKPAIYGLAASLLLIISVSAIWLPAFIHSGPAHAVAAQAAISAENPAIIENKQLTALDASRMYAKYEQMRQGTCQFPEALQIPDQHKAIYLENVVGGKLPSDLADLAVANFYLEKVRCNFTPMLMAASK